MLAAPDVAPHVAPLLLPHPVAHRAAATFRWAPLSFRRAPKYNTAETRCPVYCALLLAILHFHLALPQTAAPPPDPFAVLRSLAGKWTGEVEGQAGRGTVERSYELVLRGRFLHERNISTYPPQEKNPKGEVHEHWTIFSNDRGRKMLVMRQFHTEGFVNQYVLPHAAAQGKEIVFASEAFENLPANWRARERYEFLAPDEFVETFELAAPGKDFEVYSRTRFRRAK